MILKLLALILFMAVSIYFILDAMPIHPTGVMRGIVPAHLIDPHPSMNVMIINAVSYHAESWYSYLYVAAIRCHYHVSLYTAYAPYVYGAENDFAYLTRSWSRPLVSHPRQHISQLLESRSTICLHHLIIIATIVRSELEKILEVLLHECDHKTAHLVLVQLHQVARDLREVEKIVEKMSDLHSQTRVEVRYLAFAEHVKAFAERNMTIPSAVDIWRSTFPLDLPAHTRDDHFYDYFDFIIQGDFLNMRRNYRAFAAEVKKHGATLLQKRILFTILGLARKLNNSDFLQLPGVRLFLPNGYMPANIFYNFIHQAMGLIPLFASENYYIDRQSSTVRCSILTQTPLLASRQLLDSHQYIPEDAVWLKYDNESDVGAVLRIIQSFASPAAFRETLFMKRQRLKQLLEESYLTNERLLNTYADRLRKRTQSLA